MCLWDGNSASWDFIFTSPWSPSVALEEECLSSFQDWLSHLNLLLLLGRDCRLNFQSVAFLEIPFSSTVTYPHIIYFQYLFHAPSLYFSPHFSARDGPQSLYSGKCSFCWGYLHPSSWISLSPAHTHALVSLLMKKVSRNWSLLCLTSSLFGKFSPNVIFIYGFFFLWSFKL